MKHSFRKIFAPHFRINDYRINLNHDTPIRWVKAKTFYFLIERNTKPEHFNLTITHNITYFRKILRATLSKIVEYLKKPSFQLSRRGLQNKLNSPSTRSICTGVQTEYLVRSTIHIFAKSKTLEKTPFFAQPTRLEITLRYELSFLQDSAINL